MYVHFLHNHLHRVLTGALARVTIDMLPDVALLEIFDFYVVDEAWRTQAWCTLVHVCGKWREVVFESPRRLNLRLRCTPRTPVRETLYIWPVLPIIIWVNGYEIWDADNVIAALEHNDRICQMDFHEFPRSLFEEVLAAMQQPFPALTCLVLRAGNTIPVLRLLPDSFLGGSTPQLQRLFLDGIPFPGLPKLLLSATHLVRLDLRNIPHSGYFSPETMVDCLSVSTSVKRLAIEFESPRSCPDRKSRRPSPPTRTLLPVLTFLEFKGVSEYFEVLVARIDTPLLDKLHITFFHQLIFDTPHLTQFISRTPKFTAHDEAHVNFDDWSVWITFTQAFDGAQALELGISCRVPDWQLSSLAQVCSLPFSPFIPMVEHLYIHYGYLDLLWEDDIENSQWLEFLHPFTAVKDLYVSWGWTPHIVPVLQELSWERVTAVLPALQSLFLGPLPSEDSRLVEEGIRQFVSARHLAGHPIAVSRWEGW